METIIFVTALVTGVVWASYGMYKMSNTIKCEEGHTHWLPKNPRREIIEVPIQGMPTPINLDLIRVGCELHLKRAQQLMAETRNAIKQNLQLALLNPDGVNACVDFVLAINDWEQTLRDQPDNQKIIVAWSQNSPEFQTLPIWERAQIEQEIARRQGIEWKESEGIEDNERSDT